MTNQCCYQDCNLIKIYDEYAKEWYYYCKVCSCYIGKVPND